MKPHDDKRLPGEEELAALYRKLPDKPPGAALDAAVLRAAAAAVESTTGKPRRPRWPVALGTAATLVLAAGLAWHMRELPSATQSPALPAAVTQTTESFDAPTINGSSASDEPVQAMPAPAAARPAREKSAPSGYMTSTKPAQASHDTKIRHQAREAMIDSIAADRQRAVAASAPAYAPAPAPPAPPAPIAETFSEAAASKRQDTAAPPELVGASVAEPIHPKAADAPQPFANQASSAVTGGVSRYGASASAATPEHVAPASNATRPLEQAALAPVPPNPSARQTGDSRTRELEKIRLLLAQGQRDEARRRLTVFQHAHPDYALPPELQAELPP